MAEAAPKRKSSPHEHCAPEPSEEVAWFHLFFALRETLEPLRPTLVSHLQRFWEQRPPHLRVVAPLPHPRSGVKRRCDSAYLNIWRSLNLCHRSAAQQLEEAHSFAARTLSVLFPDRVPQSIAPVAVDLFYAPLLRYSPLFVPTKSVVTNLSTGEHAGRINIQIRVLFSCLMSLATKCLSLETCRPSAQCSADLFALERQFSRELASYFEKQLALQQAARTHSPASQPPPHTFTVAQFVEVDTVETAKDVPTGTKFNGVVAQQHKSCIVLSYRCPWRTWLAQNQRSETISESSVDASLWESSWFETAKVFVHMKDFLPSIADVKDLDITSLSSIVVSCRFIDDTIPEANLMARIKEARNVVSHAPKHSALSLSVYRRHLFALKSAFVEFANKTEMEKHQMDDILNRVGNDALNLAKQCNKQDREIRKLRNSLRPDEIHPTILQFVQNIGADDEEVRALFSLSMMEVARSYQQNANSERARDLLTQYAPSIISDSFGDDDADEKLKTMIDDLEKSWSSQLLEIQSAFRSLLAFECWCDADLVPLLSIACCRAFWPPTLCPSRNVAEEHLLAAKRSLSLDSVLVRFSTRERSFVVSSTVPNDSTKCVHEVALDSLASSKEDEAEPSARLVLRLLKNKLSTGAFVVKERRPSFDSLVHDYHKLVLSPRSS